jgi:death-on-curing protein
MSFGGEDLYPTIESKATALCFSLVMNHPFVDGNKRIGHAAMETFLVMNGYELVADVDGAETVILNLAAGDVPREELLDWVTSHVQRLPT